MVKPTLIVDTIKLALVAFLTMLLNMLQPSSSKALESSVDSLWADDEEKVVTTPSSKTRKTKARRAKTKVENEAIVDILKRRALETPDKVVYTFLDDAGKESVNLTFADVDRAARRVAATLQQDAGLKKGDRVMLAYPPGLDFAMGFWGCLYAGPPQV
ncbi:hypothetical protein SDRG_04933 [Saprolegnia diclina VS20]|uniref:AMP-dependent synthetase/ligase domain-containing protein n=1 Tax=Saprolegnia diclina (strain VS20) TaxID=1156394 RepID=T0QV74_SAPDV|nr:hypothetical protein SDRG_04933 [Saprolegnia diclina VS20]EQC37915.1 hypothetical protein SDRG_04933 [Saprolegnia diclina VS20]|eukprot:XP_008608848.1 hypothetical protein SDRG_04933 [Saprolegnia diclina VS20]